MCCDAPQHLGGVQLQHTTNPGSYPQNQVWGSPLTTGQSWTPSSLLPALIAPAHLLPQQIKESTRFCITKQSSSMDSATRPPPCAVDLHIVLGAGADWDPGLQHKEHVETHFHIFYRGNLRNEAESVGCCFLEQGKGNSFTGRGLCSAGGQKITEKRRSVFQQKKKQLYKSH